MKLWPHQLPGSPRFSRCPFLQWLLWSFIQAVNSRLPVSPSDLPGSSETNQLCESAYLDESLNLWRSCIRLNQVEQGDVVPSQYQC